MTMPLSEQNFRILFEQAPLGMALTDLQLRLVHVNPTLCTMLGYSAEELIQLTVADVTHPPDLERLRGLTKQMVDGDLSSHRIEKHCIRKDGTLLPAAVTVALMRDSSGAP